MNKNSNVFLKMLIPILFFFIGVAAMYFVVGSYPNIFATGNGNSSTTKIKRDVTVTDAGIADAVEKIYDAVVVVSTYKDQAMFSSGTGFVYKIDGNKAYILTNNHVIASGNSITVTFTNGEVVETEVVGTNTLADIAVLSVKKDKAISVAEIGKSDEVRVGDTAFAVGAPLDSVYSWTVTRGIISGKDRMVEVNLASGSRNSEEYVMKVMQTDAAINSGNSGGPLCNSNGEVVGITSLKLVDTSVEGMGFAIPIETALDYAGKIVSGETVQQPYLGVSMVDVSTAMYYPQYSQYFNKNDIKNGVLVVEVESGSPADKAGLKSGDVVTKINDDVVTSVGYLRYYLYNYKVGDKITLTYNRDGKEKTATVTLASNKKVY